MTDHFAKEAERLLRDDTLNAALNALRAEALEALVIASADEKTTILRLQQTVEVVDGIRANLKAMILRGSVADSPAGTFA